MTDGGIANILHRETIAVLVGAKVFERGEACFAEGRVLRVEAGRGELRGSVRPEMRGRPVYAVRIWMREEGLAYECTCPMGAQRQFCKHTVAIALAHLEKERRAAEREFSLLRRRVMAVDPMVLVDRLLEHARTDPGLTAILTQLTEK
ncbi:MAG TPA: hypothetical protein VK932_01445 [Kofleriaceae bacterium]|nr:hypothetical protein [Kofleriaceae bacterium]